MKKSVLNLVTRMKNNGEKAKDIIKTLNTKGWTTPRGKTWNGGNFAQFLTRSKHVSVLRKTPLKVKSKSVNNKPSIDIDFIKSVLNAKSIDQDKKIDIINVFLQK